MNKLTELWSKLINLLPNKLIKITTNFFSMVYSQFFSPRETFSLAEMRLLSDNMISVSSEVKEKGSFLAYITDKREFWEEEIKNSDDIKEKKSLVLKLPTKPRIAKQAVSPKEYWLFLKPNNKTIKYVKYVSLLREKRNAIKGSIMKWLGTYWGVLLFVVGGGVYGINYLHSSMFGENAMIDASSFVEPGATIQTIVDYPFLVFIILFILLGSYGFYFLWKYYIIKKHKLNRKIKIPVIKEHILLLFLQRYKPVADGSYANAVGYISFKEELYKEIEKIHEHDSILANDNYQVLVNYLRDQKEKAKLKTNPSGVDNIIKNLKKRIDRVQNKNQGTMLDILNDEEENFKLIIDNIEHKNTIDQMKNLSLAFLFVAFLMVFGLMMMMIQGIMGGASQAM